MYVEQVANSHATDNHIHLANSKVLWVMMKKFPFVCYFTIPEICGTISI